MFGDSKKFRFTFCWAFLTAVAVTGLLVGAVSVLAMSSRPLPSREITRPKDPNSRGAVRAIGVEVLPKNEFNIISKKPAAQSAALFVGVNDFSEDNGLAALNCAVNDAVEQAFVFVRELKLIKPENCILCLSGKPSTPVVAKQLELLKKCGVEVNSATKPKILQALRLVGRIGVSRQDIVIVSFSTHGFESRNGVYLMPTDGLRGFLEATAIYSGTVKDTIGKSRAGKKLLIVDTCRERVENSKSSGSAAAMSKGFQQAFAASSGFATLMSCSAGQYSYEDPDSGHGVFSKFLLKGLRGESRPDERGFITVGAISEYVSANVGRWMLRNKPEVRADRISTPFLAGAEVARRIPLAIGKKLTAKQVEMARMQYVNFYPPAESTAVKSYTATSGRYVVLLYSSRTNLRSILMTQFKQAFKKASLGDFDFVEESSPLDGKVLAGHFKKGRQNNADTLIVCVVETADQGKMKVYGSEFSSCSAAITVSINDVNSGKVLHNFNKSATRSSSFKSEAQEDAVTEAAQKIAPELVRWFNDNGGS